MHMIQEPAITTYAADELAQICVFTGSVIGGGSSTD